MNEYNPTLEFHIYHLGYIHSYLLHSEVHPSVKIHNCLWIFDVLSLYCMFRSFVIESVSYGLLLSRILL
ncbi:hypothetical protein HanPSC8_Chr14g0623991 [Helianthus annuus]|nr:hypothetical protein HanPSC8_Chr14g0623991 [Helianthus annuus]